MARKLRIEYMGAISHVINRGDRREPIFRQDRDRELFLKTLSETCDKTGWWVHAFCLMTNHFHLVVETPQPNLVAGMKWFLGTYTSRFNRRHQLSGHLFSVIARELSAKPEDGTRPGWQAQKRSIQSGFGTKASRGNDPNDWLDCQTAPYGHARPLSAAASANA